MQNVTRKKSVKDEQRLERTGKDKVKKRTVERQEITCPGASLAAPRHEMKGSKARKVVKTRKDKNQVQLPGQEKIRSQ